MTGRVERSDLLVGSPHGFHELRLATTTDLVAGIDFGAALDRPIKTLLCRAGARALASRAERGRATRRTPVRDVAQRCGKARA